ncbi:MAG TPA: hypothetical protein PLW93_02285 [Candidatus Absconditabacterales bacterium]|nr:hypothetical protein [Candidatus Absconditabacterales bacterium]
MQYRGYDIYKRGIRRWIIQEGVTMFDSTMLCECKAWIDITLNQPIDIQEQVIESIDEDENDDRPKLIELNKYLQRQKTKKKK